MGLSVVIAKFNPGFRLSLVDAIALTIGSVLALVSAVFAPSWTLSIGFPLVHFFLFCNVFRISRLLELLWAAIFLMLAAATVTCGVPSWVLTVMLSTCMTVAVVIAEMRKPSYHGIGWQRINPSLPDWWAKNGPRL
jgi:hypothetical protein